MFKHTNFVEFTQAFGSDDQCYAYLSKIKWKNGFKCRKCEHTECIKGRTWYYRKCQKCHYDESCTSNTLFHKLKFSITKAFWIVYQIGTMKKGMSTMELARQYGIHQQTAWYFKRKIQHAIQDGEIPKLEENVEVDETSIGGHEQGAPGRTHGKKQKVQVAIEVEYPIKNSTDKGIIKKARATIIEGYSAEHLAQGIEEMIDQEAVITTDEWSGYPKAVGERMHLQFKSDDGENFKGLHWHIFNIKNWIRGTHHKVDPTHLQRYLDEYHYRFNRRNNILSCPSRLINRLMRSPKLAYQEAEGN
jgi:hypothetical protein